MAISHLATALANSAAGTTSNNATIPGCSTGDLLLFAVINRDATAVPTVTDTDTGGNTWTRKGSDTAKVTLWYKWATAASAGKTVNATGATGSCTVVCSAIHGSLIAQGDPFDAYSWESNASGDESHAAITTSVNGCLIGLLVGNDTNDTLNPGTYTATSPTTLTEAGESLSTGGADCSLAIAFGTQATAGSTGTINWVQATNATTQSIAFAIKPEVTGVTTAPTKFVSYSFSNDASDLTGAGQNKQLETSGAGAGTWAISSLAAGAASTGSWFTNAGEPGANGVSDKTIYVGLSVTTGNTNFRLSALAKRVNSSGVVQATSPATLETTTAAAGFYWLELDLLDLGTWASGDRLRIDPVGRNSSGLAQSLTITLASTTVRPSNVAAAWSNATMKFAYGDRAAEITLSNSDLTATDTESTNFSGVRGTTQQPLTGSAKVYFEITATDVTGSPNYAVGIANRSWNLSSTTSYLGIDNNGIGWFADGSVTRNGATVATIATYSAGNTLCIAVDFSNDKIWFRVGSGDWNNDVLANENPATNTGGITISALSGLLLPAFGPANNTAVGTINLSGAFAQTVPSGFTKFDGSSAAGTVDYSITITAGAVPIVGASVSPSYGQTLSITPAGVPIGGGTVAPVFGHTVAITASAVPIGGATLTPVFAKTVSISPSAIPVTGASVSVAFGHTLAVTAGTLPIVGQAVAPVFAKTVTLTAGAVPITGADVTLGGSTSYSITITAGAVPIVGQALTPIFGRTVAITAGALPVTGQTVAPVFAKAIAITASSVPVTGQAVTPVFGHTVAITAAAVPVTGLSLAPVFARTIAITAGAVPIVGQVVSPFLTAAGGLTITAGAVPITGQVVAPVFAKSITISASAVPIVGQAVAASFGRAIAVTAGTVPITGQSVIPSVGYRAVLAAGLVPITGLDLTAYQTRFYAVTITPAVLPIVGQTIAPTYGYVAALTPGVIPIVGQFVDLTFQSVLARRDPTGPRLRSLRALAARMPVGSGGPRPAVLSNGSRRWVSG